MVGVLFVILACVFWGLDALIRYPLVSKGYDPVVIVFLEHFILTLIFLPKILGVTKRIGELRLAEIFSFLIVGAGGSAIATVCFTKSFVYLNPSMVILLQKFQPIVAISLAALILKEPVGRPFILWTAIAIIGGVLISFNDLQRFVELGFTDFSKITSENAIHGYTLVLASVLLWGAATTFGKKLTMMGFKAAPLSAGRFLIGFITLSFMVKFDSSFIFPDYTDYFRLLVMVLLSGLLGMWLYYQGMEKLNAKTVALLEMFFPFFAVIANWIFLGKSLEIYQLVGGGLLVLSSFVIQWKKY